MTDHGQMMVAGRVDREGRLISADPRLLALQIEAGGDANGEIAVPALFAVVRLARTPGTREDRWAHLLCGPVAEATELMAAGAHATSAGRGGRAARR